MTGASCADSIRKAFAGDPPPRGLSVLRPRPTGRRRPISTIHAWEAGKFDPRRSTCWASVMGDACNTPIEACGHRRCPTSATRATRRVIKGLTQPELAAAAKMRDHYPAAV